MNVWRTASPSTDDVPSPLYRPHAPAHLMYQLPAVEETQRTTAPYESAAARSVSSSPHVPKVDMPCGCAGRGCSVKYVWLVVCVGRRGGRRMAVEQDKKIAAQGRAI